MVIFVTMLVLLIAGSIVVYTLRAGISPMPSTAKARKMIVSLLPDSAEGTIYELGCGWGGLLLTLGRRYPYHRVVGIELSPLPYFVTSLRIRLSGLKNVQVIQGNFMHHRLDNAGLVICYLYPGGMVALAPKLTEELPQGAVVISNTFALPGWEPLDIAHLEDIYHTPIYQYVKRD